MKLTAHHYLVYGLRMSGVVPLLPLYDNVVDRDNVTFTLSVENSVLCDVTPCGLVEICRLLEEPATSVFKVDDYSSLKMETVGLSETMGCLYQTAQCHNAQYNNLHSHRLDNLNQHKDGKKSSIGLCGRYLYLTGSNMKMEDVTGGWRK
jgi:hypothetical protein